MVRLGIGFSALKEKVRFREIVKDKRIYNNTGNNNSDNNNSNNSNNSNNNRISSNK